MPQKVRLTEKTQKQVNVFMEVGDRIIVPKICYPWHSKAVITIQLMPKKFEKNSESTLLAHLEKFFGNTNSCRKVYIK